jgi:hypothetical protein
VYRTIKGLLLLITSYNTRQLFSRLSQCLYCVILSLQVFLAELRPKSVILKSMNAFRSYFNGLTLHIGIIQFRCLF